MNADAQPSLDCDLTLLGRGLTSDVFAWHEGTAIKLFHAGAGLAKVIHEFESTRAVHHAGFAAPKVHEVVEHQNRHGIVMERIEGPSLLDANQSKPWRLGTAVRQLARMHAALHGLPAPLTLPSQRKLLADRIAAASWHTDEERIEAEKTLASLPDGESICHGDFHPGNVILSSRGAVVIDWSTASRGAPLGDVARTTHLFDHAEVPPTVPLLVRGLFAGLRQWCHRVYLREYLRQRPGSQEEISAWRSVITRSAKSHS